MDKTQHAGLRFTMSQIPARTRIIYAIVLAAIAFALFWAAFGDEVTRSPYGAQLTRGLAVAAIVGVVWAAVDLYARAAERRR